ncbi:pentapeptide repeat-containing protein [Marinobacter nauticus]|uniref:pentapeptide repeat-containing protein n=1 Tax=Marinobacter nauticus TaxID=2743 RepID=UPI00112F801A|nr:pentapeptide repeat-containing protein [Marinobacter nauticus]TPW22693.1 pentapeptide repeat-containing protein [Marinobacter nauticus]
MRTTILVLILLSVLTILITGFWPFVSTVVFPESTWGLYNRDFFENFLVEMHGSILDLLVVGVILYWFDRKREKKNKVESAREKLRALKFYYGEDAPFRFYAGLQNLLSLGVNSIDLPEANLSKLKIDDLNLSKSNLIAASFSGSILKNVNFISCNLEAANFIDCQIKLSSFNGVNLKRAKFIGAKLKGMDFKQCDVRGAVFRNADLKSANFRGVDCSQVSFKGADLRSANFIDSRNLTIEMIRESRNYKDAKLPFDI